MLKHLTENVTFPLEENHSSKSFTVIIKHYYRLLHYSNYYNLSRNHRVLHVISCFCTLLHTRIDY